MKKQLFILSVVLLAVFSFTVSASAGANEEMYSDKAIKSLFTKTVIEKPSSLVHFAQKQKACAPAACAACPSKCAPKAEAKVEVKSVCCGIAGCNCGCASGAPCACKTSAGCGVNSLTPCAAAYSAKCAAAKAEMKSACKCGCETGIKEAKMKKAKYKKHHSKKMKKNWKHKKHLKKGKIYKNCPECQKLEVKPFENTEKK